MSQGQQPPVGSTANDASEGSNISPQNKARIHASLKKYWKANVWIMSVLLFIWAAAGLGAGILFVDKLNEYQFAGYKLGFWFAQQGSIIIFVILILVYCIVMNRLDSKHHDELQKLRNNQQ
ncbi:MAG: DUF4212 domain-containing protein [Phycisphaeraceae bacterium]|nr:DUF4212 domain-containing protein [Phycisphaeraceae bacterium]